MRVYSVGGFYHPERRSWPEAVQYNFRDGYHELLIILDKPSKDEILAVRKAPAKIGVVVDGPVIDLLYQFGHELTGDAPYSWHLVSPEGQVPPQIMVKETARAMLTTILVDASTGIIKALRMGTMSLPCPWPYTRPSLSRPACHGSPRPTTEPSTRYTTSIPPSRPYGVRLSQPATWAHSRTKSPYPH
jgi:hypothetical protein